MRENSFEKNYISIAHLIQKEFDRNVQKYGIKIKCRKGCSQCCSQIFNITLVDEYVIKKHLSTFPSEIKNLLKQKAKEYLIKLNVEPKEYGDYFLKPKLPCPALTESGECAIYEARPIICRRFGPPIYDYKNPTKIFACELNFKDGEEIIDDELIPDQTKIGLEWDKLKTEFNLQFGENQKTSTTIAEAILDS